MKCKKVAKATALALAISQITGCASFWTDAEPEPDCSESAYGLGCTSEMEIREMLSGDNPKQVIAEERAVKENGEPSPYRLRKGEQQEKAENGVAENERSRFGRKVHKATDKVEAKFVPKNQADVTSDFYQAGSNRHYNPTPQQDQIMQIWWAPERDKVGNYNSLDSSKYSYIEFERTFDVGVEDNVEENLPE